MVRIKARNYLFILPIKLKKIICHQCGIEIKKGDLTYSKRVDKRYCAECAFNLGFIKGIAYEEQIKN